MALDVGLERLDVDLEPVLGAVHVVAVGGVAGDAAAAAAVGGQLLEDALPRGLRQLRAARVQRVQGDLLIPESGEGDGFPVGGLRT